MDKGAHYHRCDFQVHSPRDESWKGKSAVTAEERSAYAERLIAACREKGLQAIGITDHHDLAFAEYVRQAASSETDENGNAIDESRRIVVFPGIELTLGTPCQALLILDADFPENMFPSLLTALNINASNHEDAKTAPVERLEHISSLRELKERLRRRLDGQAQGWFQKIIDGQDKAWGNKRIACFQTSDNRCETHAELGAHSTWVKWATPTAEALRQACLAQESRISQETPRLPAVFISGVSVSNSGFLGPVDLELNPQYSALIGGRGTGKSTILEYLRWALCDQPPGLDEDDAPNYQRRRSRLIDQTLKPQGETVEVSFVVNGVPHVVRRYSEDGSTQIKVAASEMRACSEEEVRGLLPIQAYSQKQLSDVSVRIDELNRFITTPIRMQLAQFDSRIEEAGDRIKQTYGKWQRQRTLQRALKERELEANSLSQQAESLRSSLTGLSEDDRKILDLGPEYEAADELMESWRGHVGSLAEELENAIRRSDTSRLQGRKAGYEAGRRS